jgi:4-hydroxybutyryl-CoA dehydratase/vinylacetyl-CoA-Delta-isomerase
MALKTGKEYVQSLREINPHPTVYLFGEKMENPYDHPMVKPSQNAVALSYDLVHDPLHEDLMTARSHLTGQKVNRFCHIYQSRDDLVNKIKMFRMLGQMTATCFQRCTTCDGGNIMYLATYEVDQKFGTKYHERFKKFFRHLQENDLVAGIAMTDVKGDRSLKPSEQADPDLYLHVVEEKKDGIVVRGAKAHQTGALNCHYTVVMPTRAMSPEDKDYAIAFSIPMSSPGLIHIYGRQFSDTRKLEGGCIDMGNPLFGMQETLLIFENVFVPWENVYLYKEYEFAERISGLLGSHHRCSYGGCKTGVSDVLIGATALLAQYNGVAKSSHVRSKITEMITLSETMYGCGLASAYEGHKTPVGNYMNDFLLANVCKLNVARITNQIGQLALDIAGGIVTTMPSERDLRSPEIGKYVEKYLRGVSNVPAEHRMRILRLIENLMFGGGAGGYIVESIHGAGSPEAQKTMIPRESNLSHKISLAKCIAGIKE